MKHCTCNKCGLSLIVADACIQHLHVLHGASTIGNPAVFVLGTCSVVGSYRRGLGSGRRRHIIRVAMAACEAAVAERQQHWQHK